MAVIFDRDPDAIRQHHKYIGKNKKPDPVPAAAIQDSLAIDQSRTRNVRGAWTPGEDILLMKAVEAMGTNWTAIVSAAILPGRSVQAITNRYHRELKNGPKNGPKISGETYISTEGAYEALQIWSDSPIPFQRDSAYKILSASDIISKKSSESPTLARLVEALSSADPFALQNALERNSLELIDGRNGSVDKDHWSFCIGSDFVPVKIPNLLNDAINANAGNFDILDLCAPSVTVKRKLSDKRAQKILDIERIMKIPFVAEFCTLLELGFIPYSMATKLGELQRQGACATTLKLSK